MQIFKIIKFLILSCLLFIIFKLLKSVTLFNVSIHFSNANKGKLQSKFLNHQNFHNLQFSTYQSFHRCSSSVPKCIVLSVVCCGDRFKETSTMIKSAIMLTSSYIIIELFTERNLFPLFATMVEDWPENVKFRVHLNLRAAVYPSQAQESDWKDLFRKCASVRLFFPSLLSSTDSLIYVDTDVLFMSSIDEFWDYFSQMNSSQMVALAPEHEDAATGWYNRFAKHPFYGKLGVNSGVMLMNLTRLRQFKFESYLQPILKEFSTKLTWGDQDIINIIFHYHPDKLLLLPCEYNYRPDHCMYTNTCKTVSRGIKAIHGNRATFHTNKQPVFRKIYETWTKLSYSGDIQREFIHPLKEYFNLKSTKGNCKKMSLEFLKPIIELDKRIREDASDVS